MGFITDVIMLNSVKSVKPPVEPPVEEKPNLFTNNFEQYNSTTNINGINYSSYAKGDPTNRTVTHTTTSFSSSNAYIFEGFEVGKKYRYASKITGHLEKTFLQVKCLTSSNVGLSDTSQLIGVEEIIFTIPEKTGKIQIAMGTAGGHTGSSTFAEIEVREITE